jgi:PHD-finger
VKFPSDFFELRNRRFSHFSCELVENRMSEDTSYSTFPNYLSSLQPNTSLSPENVPNADDISGTSKGPFPPHQSLQSSEEGMEEAVLNWLSRISNMTDSNSNSSYPENANLNHSNEKDAEMKRNRKKRSFNEQVQPELEEIITIVSQGGDDRNNSICSVCSQPGLLVCCDGCVQAFHEMCLTPKERVMSKASGEWYCKTCLKPSKKKERESLESRFRPTEVNETRNRSYCAVCNDHGFLVCCDGCENSFHQECISSNPLKYSRSMQWLCQTCCASDPTTRFFKYMTSNKFYIYAPFTFSCSVCQHHLAVQVTKERSKVKKSEKFTQLNDAYYCANSTSIRCKGCPRLFHRKCLPPIKTGPNEAWFCDECSRIRRRLSHLVTPNNSSLLDVQRRADNGSAKLEVTSTENAFSNDFLTPNTTPDRTTLEEKNEVDCKENLDANAVENDSNASKMVEIRGSEFISWLKDQGKELSGVPSVDYELVVAYKQVLMNSN